MAKEIHVPFGNFYYEKFSKPIRNKTDFIFLILDTLNMLDLGNSAYDVKGEFVIKIDKMSRIFYYLTDKYYSVVFPFSVEKQETSVGKYIIYDAESDVVINDRLVSLMRGIAEKIDFVNSTVEKVLEQIYFDTFDDGYSDTDFSKCWNIIWKLYAAEPGYIRYDYDQIHYNDTFHPLNHLDVNYSAKCTYKLGLRERLRPEEFINLLDVQKECRFVV